MAREIHRSPGARAGRPERYSTGARDFVRRRRSSRANSIQIGGTAFPNDYAGPPQEELARRGRVVRQQQQRGAGDGRAETGVIIQKGDQSSRITDERGEVAARPQTITSPVRGSRTSLPPGIARQQGGAGTAA